MFFVKAAFWIFLILLLMPSNDREKSDFYIAAGRTMSDKVRTTIEMLEDVVRSDGDEADPYSEAPRERHRGESRHYRGASSNLMMIAPEATAAMPVSAEPAGSQDTLRPDDREPDWRGPGRV